MAKPHCHLSAGLLDEAHYAILPWFSTKLGTGRQAGLIGGLAGAWLVSWPGHGEYLTAIVLGFLLIAFLRRWTRNQATRAGSLPQRAALSIPLLTFPLIYYFVEYMPRYRVPIDWLLFILAGAAIWRLLKRAG